MSIQKLIDNLSDDDLVYIFDTYTSASDYLRSINAPLKGQYSAPINKRGTELNLVWKASITVVICPVCSKSFEVGGNTGKKRNQITCSYACSNKHFRSGSNNGNYKGNAYRTICFERHKKECVVCGENKVVSVHHLDEDHGNNAPENLIPLCPTHHTYMHSNYKSDIQPIIDKYIQNWPVAQR